MHFYYNKFFVFFADTFLVFYRKRYILLTVSVYYEGTAQEAWSRVVDAFWHAVKLR